MNIGHVILNQTTPTSTPSFKQGQKVIHSGQVSKIVKVCTGIMSGSYIIEVNNRPLCVNANDIVPVKNKSFFGSWEG